MRRSFALVITASLLAGCATKQEVEAAQKQREFDLAYDRCIGRNVGLFSAASIEVMRECDRQARLASGTSGSAQDPQGLDPKGAGPTAEGGDAQGTAQ